METPFLQRAIRVLVIDDDPDLNDMMVTSLRFLGKFEVASALDGLAGLTLCVDAHPDVVVIDVRMPELDGYQVVRALRGDPATEDVPIIMLTALAQEYDELTGMLSGTDVYLRKPLDPFQLVQAINDVMALNTSQREARMNSLSTDPAEAPVHDGGKR